MFKHSTVVAKEFVQQAAAVVLLDHSQSWQ